MFCLLTNEKDIYLYKDGFVSLYDIDNNKLIKNCNEIMEMSELKQYIDKCYPSNYIVLYKYYILFIFYFLIAKK